MPAIITTKDEDLLDALMDPRQQIDYRQDARAFVRIDTSLRVYWHTLFDTCPSLLELSGPEGLSIFHPFMSWAADHRLRMDWTLYLQLYAWLTRSEFRHRLNDRHEQQLVAAAAARWATSDRGPSAGVAISRQGSADLLVGWKCRRIDQGREIEVIALDTPLPSPDGLFGYFFIPDFELAHFPGWQHPDLPGMHP